MSPRNSSIVRRAATAALLLSFPLILSSCNVGGGVFSKLQGPATHPALYTPHPEPMAVLVENYASGSGSHLDSDQIAAFLTGELTHMHVAPMVDAAKVYELRVEDPAKFHSLSVAAIGRAVGAKQILYVDVQSSNIDGPTGGEAMKGTLSGVVKIVDTDSGDSRWPTETEGGYPFEYATPWLSRGPENNEITMKEKLNRSVADHVARFFYTWTEDE
jgi:hypothetical protein